jgi:hypothetical protein
MVRNAPHIRPPIALSHFASYEDAVGLDQVEDERVNLGIDPVELDRTAHGAVSVVARSFREMLLGMWLEQAT